MGGEAFTSGPAALLTPRMPRLVYLHVKEQCGLILKRYFNRVATPVEAPDKVDYGDIDFLVTDSTALYNDPHGQDCMMKDLGAVKKKSGPTTNFAIPWPAMNDEGTLAQSSDREDTTFTSTDTSSKFIQVDVTILHTGSLFFDWELFHKAHGDLWNMLGSTIRKFGLTVNHQGLYLRIQEIELIDRKKSLVLLTHDSSRVLKFLGLDEKRYWQQFDSVQDMLEYAASCRFFCAKEAEKEQRKEPSEQNDVQAKQDKKELKHNDRQRLSKRPLFRRWIEEFIPECRQNGKFLRDVPTREQTLHEAFELFAGVEDLYYDRLTKFRIAQQADEVWRSVIKGGVPELEDTQFRSAAVKGLKAIIMADDCSWGIVPSKHFKLESGFYDVEAVKEFVKSYWQHVGKIGMEKSKERAVKGRGDIET